MSFLDRVAALPVLGLGVSTEYGAGDSPTALDIAALHRAHPAYAAFLEVGVEILSGLDRHTRAWVDAGLPTTYHFLDINLDDPADFDPVWLDQVRGTAATVKPAWMCGDAGMWHFGGREPGHMLLLPPILSADAARDLGAGVARLRDETGYEVLPENPPGAVFLGDLHLLDFFGRVLETADTGMLLDAAHLAIYQRLTGHAPLDGLDGFPLDRVVELHVAGGTLETVDGWQYVEDDHTPAVLEETWRILEHVVPRAPNLRAVVFECERNPLPDTLEGFARITEVLGDSPLLGRGAVGAGR